MADHNTTPPADDLPPDDGPEYGFSDPDHSDPMDHRSPDGYPQSARRLELVKSGHRYVFRYAEGDESEFLASLMDMARDPKNPLDMFDAAILSHQLGVRLAKQLEEILKP